MKKFFYSDIGTCHDFGGCDAFVVDTEAENLGNWLETCGFDKEKLLGDLRNRFKRIAIILGITVDDKHRGEGYWERVVGGCNR